jgi:replication factor A1
MFLFTIRAKVIAQFTVPKQILLETDPITTYIETRSPEAFAVKKPVIKNPKINELEQRMRHINVKARVLETPKPHLVKTRFGTTAYVSNVLIADETGTIRLSLWNQQINKVSVDDVIKIENARVAKYRGNRQLRIERHGTLNVIDGEGFPPLIN